MNSCVRTVVGVLLIGSVVGPVAAQESRWGSPDEPTVKAMIAVEKMWAESSCAPQPGLKDAIADDFQGTSTRGERYGKADAITTDTKALARECELGEVKVRFFGDDVAIAYGAESRLRKDEAGQESKRCQVWTDTWLKRQGKWEIVAAQDGVVECK
jgi:hypothetical protein